MGTNNNYFDNYSPISHEGEFANLEIKQGQIPEDLNGTLYRNGPNPQFPLPNDHIFEGDGMIHAVTLQKGVASYQNKWARTEKFLLEQKEGRRLFRNFGMDNDPITDGTSDNVANTNIIYHANKLLALQESAAAIQITPEDLSTKGEYDYNKCAPALSAHPHFDPQTGELLWHNYTPLSNDIQVYVVNKEGQITRSEKLKIPYSSFMHDIMFTQQHIILPVMPLTFSLERVKEGGPIIMFESNLHSHFGFLPRYGSIDDTVWLTLPAFYIYHFINAFEQQGKIYLDGFKSEKAPLFPDETGKNISSHDYPRNYCRFIFDLETETYVEKKLFSVDADFPEIDRRFMGQNYNHVFAASKYSNKSKVLDSLVHFNLSNQTKKVRSLGNNNGCHEPIFVPKNNNCNEGEGYILSIVFNQDTQSSDLLILDAMNIKADPIATVVMPHRVPYSFHGSWVGL